MNKVAVIIPFYNAKQYIIDAVESIIAQTYAFENICLYLVDDGSTDESQHYAMLYDIKHSNVTCIHQKNKGVSAARNKGIQLALLEDCEYIFFLDADDKYQKEHIQKCIELLDEYPESAFVSGKVKFFESKEGLSEKYTLSIYNTTQEIDIFEEELSPLYIGHVAQGGWRASIFEYHQFNEDYAYSEDIDFIFGVISKYKFVYSEKIEYLYRLRYAQDSVVDVGPNHLEWYSRVWEIFSYHYERYIGICGYVPRIVQQTVFENLHALFVNKQNTEILNQIDMIKLKESMKFIVDNTDEDILNFELVDYWQKMYFFQIKYGTPNLTRWAPIPTFVMNDTGETDIGMRFGHLGSDPLVIHQINEKQGVLTIYASLRCITYNHFELDIKSNFEVQVHKVAAPFEQDKLFFANKEIFPRKYYEIKINLHSIVVEEEFIQFFLTTDYNISIGVRYDAVPLSGIGFGMPFTLGDEYIVKRTTQNNVLSISPFTEKELINVCSKITPYAGIGKPAAESVTKFNFLKSKILDTFRAFSNQRIWLFMDRGNEIGNNAEILFRHCIAKDDGIQKYYIIPDESYAERFEGLPYMIFGTIEYQLLCCFAEKFISSFLFDEGLTLEFGVDREQKEQFENIRNFKKITRSFFRGDIVHIQHGVIAQDISFYLNKFNEDTRLLCNVSKKEHAYVTNELRHAVDEKVLKLTGLPTYDLLENIKNNPNSQKAILFAPSFDRNFNSKGKYRSDYKHSSHFQYIKSIVSSDEILDYLENSGYTLYFKPHYMLIQQLKDFALDSRIKVIIDEIDKYELYAMCDLMITDYSGIAFDFGYLKKPIIYAHFLENPKFDESYFSFKEHGFGDVCNNIQDLTKVIIENIDKQCKISSKYKSRINNFYTFHDDKNCERVYNEIIKLPDTRKNIFKE